MSVVLAQEQVMRIRSLSHICGIFDSENGINVAFPVDVNHLLCF